MSLGIKSKVRGVADDLRDVGGAVAWVDAEIAAACLPEETRNRIGVCLEEALVNLITHGRAAENQKDIELALTADSDGATILISDRCIPFDVTREAPPTAPTKEDMHEGGMGIRLLRAFATEIAYASSGGRNTLAMIIRPKGPDIRASASR